MRNEIKEAMRVISEAIHSDEGYAQGWQANIAMARLAYKES